MRQWQASSVSGEINTYELIEALMAKSQSNRLRGKAAAAWGDLLEAQQVLEDIPTPPRPGADSNNFYARMAIMQLQALCLEEMGQDTEAYYLLEKIKRAEAAASVVSESFRLQSIRNAVRFELARWLTNHSRYEEALDHLENSAAGLAMLHRQSANSRDRIYALAKMRSH